MPKYVRWLPNHFPIFAWRSVVGCGVWTDCEDFGDPFGGVYVDWAVMILAMQIQRRAQGERVTQGLHHKSKRQKSQGRPIPISKVANTTQQPIFYFLVCYSILLFLSRFVRFILYSFPREQR